jgi:hypothetical protein
MAFVNNRYLGEELTARGLVPPGCRLLELIIKPDGALLIRYEKFIGPDELSVFAEALQAVATRVKVAD